VRIPRPRQLLRRPLRLPQLLGRPSKPDDPRIFSFNAERDDVVSAVTERVVDDAVARGSLQLLLNETAHLEVLRLEQQKDAETAESLSFWRGLMKKLARMSPEEGRDALARIVGHMARDVAGNFDPRVYWLARRLVPKVVTGAMQPRALVGDLLDPSRNELRRLVTIQGCVDELHHLSRVGTVVVVPTHSSNLDSLAVGNALSMEDLPPVVYGAGKNLFSNPIISFFMHNLGAYRVDRRIRASLYKDVLKAYSTEMIERGYHSLFFPGGTRSRSGAIERRLKLGLAGTAHTAFARSCERGRPQRVFFVPVTINYELVLEAETLIEDFLKDAGRARYIIDDDEFSQIDRWYAFFNSVAGYEAACVLRFGQPVDPYGNPVDEEGESHAPDGRRIDPASYVLHDGEPRADADRDAGYARALGERLVDAYERETVIMSTQLFAHVLFRHLVEYTPGVDLFGRMRRRGEVVVPREQLRGELGRARDRLVRMQERGEVCVSPVMRREDPDAIISRALAAWRYHARPVVHHLGPEIVAEDPPLLFYYQNRMVPFAERIADDTQLAVAREIAEAGRRA
jgi:glycerol-3-phosphate O-acyltransferase